MLAELSYFLRDHIGVEATVTILVALFGLAIAVRVLRVLLARGGYPDA